MRTLLFIFPFLLFACVEEVKQVNDFVAKQEEPLTEETRGALTQAMDECFRINRLVENSESRGGVGVKSFVGLSEKEYKQIDFTRFPLYSLDVKKFVKDPEQLMECILPATDQMLFAGRRNGRLSMSVHIKKQGGQWRKGTLGIMREDDFLRNYANLPELVKVADNHEFYFLECETFLAVVYKKNGMNYFSLTNKGEGLTESRFAEMILELYKLNHPDK